MSFATEVGDNNALRFPTAAAAVSHVVALCTAYFQSFGSPSQLYMRQECRTVQQAVLQQAMQKPGAYIGAAQAPSGFDWL